MISILYLEVALLHCSSQFRFAWILSTKYSLSQKPSIIIGIQQVIRYCFFPSMRRDLILQQLDSDRIYRKKIVSNSAVRIDYIPETLMPERSSSLVKANARWFRYHFSASTCRVSRIHKDHHRHSAVRVTQRRFTCSKDRVGTSHCT